MTITDQQNMEFDKVDITYYTDPLCCWSWAFEPQWTRLRQEFKGKIHWRYCMAGLLPDWENYSEPSQGICCPRQMAGIWLHAQQESGMPVSDAIWLTNPPASSYPACIAIKCAQLQSPLAGEMYLRMLREAVMIHGLNISKEEIYMTIASKLSLRAPSVFDLKLFEQALQNNSGLRLFREDLQKVSDNQVSKFPTLIFSKNGSPSQKVEGYMPYESLVHALKQIAPDIQQHISSQKKGQEIFYWNLTERESVELNQW